MNAEIKTQKDSLNPVRAPSLLPLLPLLLTIFSFSLASAQDPLECDTRFLTADGGMRAYWTFDDPADPATDNYADHHGQNFGATWVASGVVGGALSFDGIDDFVEVVHDPAFAFTAWDSYTIAVWFLNDGGGDAGPGYGQKILAKNTWGEDLWMSVLPSTVANGELQVVTCHDVSDIGDCDFMHDDSHIYTCGEWHHAVLVKSGTHGELWVDGILKAVSEGVQSAVNTQPLYIGFSPHPDHYQQKHWSGLIDELAIFDRVLTPEEIVALHATSEAGLNYCHLARIWHVPGDAPTIQAGIDSATAGEVVEIACGTYLEHDLVMKPGVGLRSETGVADCVVIDAQQLGRLVSFEAGEQSAWIEGITFTGGVADRGGGIHCRDARLFLAGCIVTNCEAIVDGGGVFCDTGDLSLDRCTIVACTADLGGGLGHAASSVAITATLIAYNDGMSIHHLGPAPVLNCCDLFGNTAGDWIGAFADQVALRGNFGADPCFCDQAAGVLTLCADSFCLPGNHPWGCDDLVGALAQGCEACNCQGPVAIEPAGFTVETSPAEVVIRWQSAWHTSPTSYRLVGGDGADSWPLAIEATGSGGFEATDRSTRLAAGGRFVYDLYGETDTGGWGLLRRETVALTPLRPASPSLAAYPNPFNPATTLEFALSIPAVVTLAIYDLNGRQVRSLVTDEILAAGRHEEAWRAVDDRGRPVPSGVYVARLMVEEADVTTRIVLLK